MVSDYGIKKNTNIVFKCMLVAIRYIGLFAARVLFNSDDKLLSFEFKWCPGAAQRTVSGSV